MSRYKTTLELDAVDAAYIAGLIDGEGTITLARKHAGEHRQLVVSISSTERAMLEFVLLRAGAGKITSKRTTRDHHAPSYAYAIWNRQAISLLKQTARYLRSYKQRRADLVLAHYIELTPRNGKYTPAMRAARTDFEQVLLSIRANCAHSFTASSPASASALASSDPASW